MTQMIGKEELPQVINKEELTRGKTARWFEGYRYGDVDVSFFLVDSPPGGGSRLHKHPYEEVFVTLEGEATFTVGQDTIKVSAGQIVVAPAGVPHKFVNSGSGPLRQVDIHPSGRIQQVNIPRGGLRERKTKRTEDLELEQSSGRRHLPTRSEARPEGSRYSATEPLEDVRRRA